MNNEKGTKPVEEVWFVGLYCPPQREGGSGPADVRVGREKETTGKPRSTWGKGTISEVIVRLRESDVLIWKLTKSSW